MRPSPSDCCLSALLVLWLAWPAVAQEGSPDVVLRDTRSTAESARFLLVPIGARAVGLGGAVAAGRGDTEGVLWNPASLAQVGGSAVFLHGANDFGTASQVLGGLARWKDVQLGLTYYHFGLGTVDARDASNRDIGTIELDNDALILSGAYPLGGWLDVGVNYKLVRVSADCSGSCEAFDDRAIAHVFDLGFIAAPPGLPGLNLGAVLRNLGAGIAYAGGPSDPLPARLRLGASVDVLQVLVRDGADRDLGLLVRGDIRQTFTEFDDLDGFAGVEVAFRHLLYLRGGYAWAGEGRQGPSLGLGLRYGRLGVDVGRAFDDFARFDSDAPFQLSLGFRL